MADNNGIDTRFIDKSRTAPPLDTVIASGNRELIIENIQAQLGDNFKFTPRQKDLLDKYLDGWREDFKDANDSESFVTAVINRTRKGFKSLDEINYPKNKIKGDIELLAKEIDKRVGDNSSEMTVAERTWNVTKGVGKFMDGLTTTEVLWLQSVLCLTFGAVSAAAPTAAKAVQASMVAGGAASTAKGAYDAVTAETPEEAQAAGAEVAGGALLLTGSGKTGRNLASKTAEGVKGAAQKVGTEAKATVQKFGTKYKAASVEREFQSYAKKNGCTMKSEPDQLGLNKDFVKFTDSKGRIVRSVARSSDGASLSVDTRYAYLNGNHGSFKITTCKKSELIPEQFTRVEYTQMRDGKPHLSVSVIDGKVQISKLKPDGSVDWTRRYAVDDAIRSNVIKKETVEYLQRLERQYNEIM